MALVKNAYWEELMERQGDQNADEFDNYHARLHAVLANLDWLMTQQIPGPSRACVEYLRRDIEEMMK